MAQRLKRLPPTWETRAWSLGWEDPLEKEMVIHSSILAWRIPWMEKPGRLHSTGSSEEWNHSRFCLVSWPSSSRNVRTFYERAMYLSQGRRNHGNTHPYQRERHLEFRVLNPRVTGWGLSIRNWHAFLLQVNYFLSTTVQPLFFCRVKHECVFLEKHTFRAGDKKKIIYMAQQQ